MVAVQLEAREPVARGLTTLGLAIMQNLGDWHVLNAMRVAHARISPGQPRCSLGHGRDTQCRSTGSQLPARRGFCETA